jgi:hypothetical protein
MLGGYSFVRKRAFILALRMEDEQKARRERARVWRVGAYRLMNI